MHLRPSSLNFPPDNSGSQGAGADVLAIEEARAHLAEAT
jgi:hypothetical protein